MNQRKKKSDNEDQLSAQSKDSKDETQNKSAQSKDSKDETQNKSVTDSITDSHLLALTKKNIQQSSSNS